MTTGRALRGVAVLAVLVGAVAGCGPSGTATKAGGSAPVVTLTLGTDDHASAPTGPVVEAFAAAVRELSDGSLLVEPVWNANTPDGPEGRDWDQRIARRVVAGDLDLALVPARAWDTEGVTSLRVLSAPLLITSQALMAEVARGEVADEALRGLEAVGVTGLALVPEGLRHVFAYGSPLLVPADFAGTTIRTPRSNTGYAVFRAWGATPEDLVGAAFDTAMSDGTLAGADSSFARASSLGGGLTVAGNLTTSGNLQTLVVGSGVLDGLTPDQVDVLRAAAVRALEGQLADAVDEAALAEAFCAEGGTVVLAGDHDLAALEAAAAPVYAELERDPVTAALLSQVRELRDALPDPAPVPPCSAGAGPETAPVGTRLAADTSAAFPSGVYRRDRSPEVLQQAGMTREDAVDHGGMWTLTFEDGRVVVEDVRTRDGRSSTGRGAYCVADGRVTVALDQDGGCAEPTLFSAAWALEGRELRLEELRGGGSGGPAPFAEALWGGAWTRID